MRKIVDTYELNHNEMHKSFIDIIRKTGDWRKRGYFLYQIPYSFLRRNEVKNLITVGKYKSLIDLMRDLKELYQLVS